jgi:hypothetical protein
MLNEWSDRVPPRPPRPLLLKASFWLTMLLTLASAGFALNLASRLLG